MSIYSRGTRGCTACEYAKTHRRFNLSASQWEFRRYCGHCGCVYVATVDEYNRDHPDLQHTEEPAP